jgi:diguanylate cyclase (GGDEF)-like protein
MQTKITLLLIFLGVLPACILGCYTLKYQRDVLDASQQMYQGFSSHIKSEISRRIRGYRILLATTAQMLPRDRLLDAAECHRALARVLAEDRAQEKGLEGLAVFDFSKRMVASVGQAPQVRNRDLLFSAVAFDTYGGAPSMQAAAGPPIELRGLPPVAGSIGTTPYVEESFGGFEMQLRFLVLGENDEVRGALVASLSPEYLSRSLNQILSELVEISQKVDIYVLDSVDRRIAATRDARYHEEPVINPAVLGATDPEMAARTELKLKTFYTPDWRVVLVPKAAALEPLKKTRETLERVVLAGIMAAVVLGLLVTRMITTPLSHLVQSAQAISEGRLEQPVEVKSSDEIGDLAANFELMRQNLWGMRENLKDRIKELDILHDVGKMISSTLNLSELLKLILELVMKVLKAERGSIMLLDEEKQELRVAVANGLAPDVIETARAKVGDKSVASFVLETGRPLLIADPHKSPSFQRIKEARIHQGSLMAVPLVAKEKKLGVFNLSKGAPYTLDERDLEFFKALSNQAAIAIENARLYEMAIKDELTKLYVRRYFDQRLKEELRRAKRYRSSVTVMLLDIDHFKGFNDTYGHSAGDEVLCFLARVMRESVRNVDIVSRYGGEEFAILCPEQSINAALLPAERIRSTVEATELTLCGAKVRCTVSIGVASYPHDAQRPETIVEVADQALYHAKYGGRNRVSCYKDLPVALAGAPGERPPGGGGGGGGRPPPGA